MNHKTAWRWILAFLAAGITLAGSPAAGAWPDGEVHVIRFNDNRECLVLGTAPKGHDWKDLGKFPAPDVAQKWISDNTPGSCRFISRPYH